MKNQLLIYVSCFCLFAFTAQNLKAEPSESAGSKLDCARYLEQNPNATTNLYLKGEAIHKPNRGDFALPEKTITDLELSFLAKNIK